MSERYTRETRTDAAMSAAVADDITLVARSITIAMIDMLRSPTVTLASKTTFVLV